MSDKILKPVVMALGYFDSVHLGHKKVIETAREYARENNLKLVVFTFKGNLKAVLSKSDDKCVYLFNERKNLLKEMINNHISDVVSLLPNGGKYRRSCIRQWYPEGNTD